MSLFGLLLACGHAQTSVPAAPSLGLSRLEKGKNSDDGLSAQGVAGARNGEKDGARFLALDAAKEWSRPLRGGERDLVFVSYSVYASVGTKIEVGGARLVVADSDILAYGELLIEDNGRWRGLGIHVPMDYHDGKILARFSALTLRLDRNEGTWDLYHGAKLVAEDLPLPTDKGAQRFVLQAGEQGAMLNGLVQSDENPLYADANGNGVDDAFEQQNKGRLLSSSDGKAARKEVIAAWRKHQRTHRPPALFVNLPLPD
jgi:hypothetical protein